MHSEDFYKESTSNEMIKNSDVIILASRWSEKYFDDIEKFQLFTKKIIKNFLVFLNRPEFQENINNLTLLDFQNFRKNTKKRILMISFSK